MAWTCGWMIRKVWKDVGSVDGLGGDMGGKVEVEGRTRRGRRGGWDREACKGVSGSCVERERERGWVGW